MNSKTLLEKSDRIKLDKSHIGDFLNILFKPSTVKLIEPIKKLDSNKGLRGESRVKTPEHIIDNVITYELTKYSCHGSMATHLDAYLQNVTPSTIILATQNDQGNYDFHKVNKNTIRDYTYTKPNL